MSEEVKEALKEEKAANVDRNKFFNADEYSDEEDDVVEIDETELAEALAAMETINEGDLKKIIKGVLEHRKEIDAIISKVATEWPLDKINLIDRNVLRMGLFELLWGNHDEAPPKVAINEAIELA